MTTSIRSSVAPLHYAYPGIPDSWNKGMRLQAELDLSLVSLYYDGFAEHLEMVDPLADIEDFWEQVARAAAIIRAAQFTKRQHLVQSADVDWPAEQLAERQGPVATIEENDNGVDPLLLHPLVISHGGRWLSLAGYSDEPGELDATHDVIELALSRARAGVEKVVVKLAQRKAGLTVVNLHPAITAAEINDQLLGEDSDLGWSFIRIAGRRGTLLIQDWIEMTYEYRLFVVDGVVVTSAGCLEECTPYSREHADVRFDARMRRHRGNNIDGRRPSAPEFDSHKMARFLAVGDKLAAQHGGTVVIDVALNADGDVIVLELNTLPNAGLYASNPDVLHRALATASDHGYVSYAWAVNTENLRQMIAAARR